MNNEFPSSRVRDLIKSAAAVGLKVAPLALMAAQLAHGTVVAGFNYTGGSSSAVCSPSTCTVTSGTAGGLGSPLGGTIHLGFTPTSLTSTSGGSSALDLHWGGNFNTPLTAGQNYNFSIFFGLADSNGVPLNWDLKLSGALNGEISGTVASPPSSLAYMTDLGTALSTNSTTESIDLFVSWAGGTINGGNSFTVDVPLGTSVDISLAPVLATPEPATLLVGPVLGALALFRRRRNRR